MKITYIHQYFNTPETGGSLRSYYLAKAMVNAGFDVAIITASNNPGYRIENICGIQVHYLPIAYDNSFGFYRRLYAFSVFLLKAGKLSFQLKSQLIYASSTPLTIGLLALLLNLIKKTPYIFEVRDLWPQAPVELGFIKNPLLIKLLCMLEKSIYRHALSVVALSVPIQHHIHKYCPDKEVIVITNMSDTKFFSGNNEQPLSDSESRFTICYIGTAGYANHLDYLLNTAQYFSEQHPGYVRFIIAARGKELERIKNTASLHAIQNVFFTEYQDREGVRKLLHNADFSYLSFLPTPVLESCSPNKLFDSLAAGVPVISNSQGWWVSETLAHQCGLYYDPAYPAQLYKQLKNITTHSLESMKINALKLARQKYSREHSCDRLITHVRKVYSAYLRGL